MSYVIVENFAGGVDRSRPIYASNSGTLWAGINGHMTRGGDFEKRKAFVEYVAVPSETVLSLHKTDYSLADNPLKAEVQVPIFVGVVSDANGLIVYLNSDAIVPPVTFTDVRYVRIDHPVKIAQGVDDGVIPMDNDPLAESVVSYDLYDGKVLALIKFENGEVIPYYDGQPVREFVEGLDYFGEVPASFTVTTYHFTDQLKKALDREFAANPTILAHTVALSRLGDGTAQVQIAGFSAAVTCTVTRTNADGTGSVTLVNASTTTAQFNLLLDSTTQKIGKLSYRYNVRITVIATGLRINIGLLAKPLSPNSTSTVRTYKRKLYLATKSILNFSANDSAILFDRDANLSAGFINMSTQTAGSDELTALQAYQDKLAIFSRRNIQVWYMDSSPALNQPTQVLRNTGTLAPKSVVGFGDLDVFYLSDTGVRSIRARDSSNTASVSDVGTAVDALVREFIVAVGNDKATKAVGIVEPLDGRYMLAIGNKVLVFSYFASKSISAWSWYELSFEVEEFYAVGDRVYARSGFKIYLLGGADGNTYGSDYEVTAQLPFMSAKRPATFKQIKGVDIAATGEWNFSMLTNPKNISEKVHCGIIEGVTYTEENIGAIGHFTHVAPLLKHKGAGKASISSIAVHYDGGDEE